MFDVAPTELLLVAVVAVVVIGPKDLPKAMRFAGYWVGKARGVARQFRSGFDEMIRESELAEMEKKWSEDNARIMREHPPTAVALPAPEPSADGVEDAAVMTVEPTIIDQGNLFGDPPAELPAPAPAPAPAPSESAVEPEPRP